MKQKKILLVGERLRHRSFNGANKALPVLASALCNAGVQNVKQLDLERKDLTINDVVREASDADLVAFSGCLTPQLPEIDKDTKKIYDQLQKIGRDTPILVGGYASKSIEDVARGTPWVNAYFDGEGENAIVQIVELIEKGCFKREMQTVKGMCFVDSLGKFHHSTSSRVKNFDSINQNFELVHISELYDFDIFNINRRQLKTAQLHTQRGCPWTCDYCNKSTESNAVTKLGEESMRRQLKELKAKGYGAVYLDVDTFTVNKEEAKREARILKEEGFVWGSNTRIDQIDKELMDYFVMHNCVYLFFGVEHTKPEVSLAIGKFNGRLESKMKQAEDYRWKVEQAFRDMGAVGLPSSYFTILGLPKAVLDLDRKRIISYEPTTFEEDIASIQFGLERCNPDYLNFNLLRFMPGSIAADLPGEHAFSCVRPSGCNPITAGWFLPRIAKMNGYKVPENHGVYRLCESVGANQPTTTAMDPERLYGTITLAIQLINERISSGEKPTKLFIDQEVLELKLVEIDPTGRYKIAPLKDFDALHDGE